MNAKGDANRSVRMTKQRLYQALITLLQQKSLREITVRELTELAGISRGTFYFHYADIYALMDQMEAAQMAPEIEKQLGIRLIGDHSPFRRCYVKADAQEAEQLLFHLLCHMVDTHLLHGDPSADIPLEVLHAAKRHAALFLLHKKLKRAHHFFSVKFQIFMDEAGIRHSKIRCSRRRFRTQIRHKISDSKIRFMAYGRYNRDLRFVNAPGYDFFVEGPEFFHGSTASARNDRIDIRIVFTQIPDRIRDLLRRSRTMPMPVQYLKYFKRKVQPGPVSGSWTPMDLSSRSARAPLPATGSKRT